MILMRNSKSIFKFRNQNNVRLFLEHKLEKTRQIKQGMMQQLLTGKIRLV